MSTTVTATQAATIKAIVNLFETGHLLGDYGQVTVLAGDTGHLTFGRSQTTLGSGNLHKLLERYCHNPGARFRRLIMPVLPRTAARDTTLDGDARLHNVMRASADDEVMRDLQDEFFDEVYFIPATKAAERMGIGSPLGLAVVYDSFVHGSWVRIRDRVAGTLEALGERLWVDRYVTARRRWLASHPRADLRTTVYRMDALRRSSNSTHGACRCRSSCAAPKFPPLPSPDRHQVSLTVPSPARARCRLRPHSRYCVGSTFGSCSWHSRSTVPT